MKKRKTAGSDFKFEIRKVFRTDQVDTKGNSMDLMVVVLESFRSPCS